MKKNKIKQIFSLKKLGILFLVNLVISIILTLAFHDNHDFSHLKMFTINWIFSNCIGFSISFFLNILELFRFGKWTKIILAFITILLASILGGFLGSKLVAYFFKINVHFLNSVNFLYFLLISLIFGILGYLLFIFLEEIHQRKIQLLEEKQARTQAELESLRTRINPHFLFNTLNSISGLIYISPEKADDILQKLSDLMRYTLNVAETKELNIKEEIEVVQDYLEIEKIRLDTRLNYSIINESHSFYLPPLIILTLVENAVKHGISPALGGGIINIKVKENQANIVITVYNTGIVLVKNYQKGFGLSALSKLLELHYQGKSEFKLESIEEGTLAKIVIKKGKL